MLLQVEEAFFAFAMPFNRIKCFRTLTLLTSVRKKGLNEPNCRDQRHTGKSGGIDLVVTDSQAFALVSSIVPQVIPLTSFSMLQAAGKGDFAALVNGLTTIPTLQEGDQILISEACSHNVTHEDIGRVKIPRLLEKITGKQLVFSFTAGPQTAEDVSVYRLGVHCGACMISKKAMRSRVRTSREAGVPMTNYGLLLAYGTGTLGRCLNGFRQKGLIG